MQDITDYLAFEVKKEMADRYFGFRKQIEDDTVAYKDRIAHTFLDLETDIGFNILRLYMLLQEERQIAAFISLTGLPEDFFFDSYILNSPSIRQRVFEGITTRGLTRKRRFINLFFDTYKELTVSIEEYRKTLDELTEEQESIAEDIVFFYKNNDIDTIMNFIRRLDSPEGATSTLMQTGRTSSSSGRLADQLRLYPPQAVSEVLPTIPSIPALQKVRSQLLKLINHAHTRTPDLDVRKLCSGRLQ